MTLTAAIGASQALDGREAAAIAARQALGQVGRYPPVLAIVIASHHHPIQQVQSGVAGVLTNTPVIGLSTVECITAAGPAARSVIVVLLAGDRLTGRADWWSNLNEAPAEIAAAINQNYLTSQGNCFLAADGLSSQVESVLSALSPADHLLFGCLSSGDLRQGRTYQIGGGESGSDGLAAAMLSGELTIGIGLDHGWQPVGAYSRITSAREEHLYELDHRPVAEAYARLFGYPVEEWSSPPLNELVRLYPLGIEQGPGRPLLVRSPLMIEPDGNFRMAASLPVGAMAHILVSSKKNCLGAAERAARQALETLGGVTPRLALIWEDISWRMLFEAQAGQEIELIRSILGVEVPLAGGYTLGQIAQANGGAELYNQHIEVVLIGE